MVHSSQIISNVSCKSFPKRQFLWIEYTDLSSKDTAKCNLVESAVFPSFNKVAAIPEDATASALRPNCRTLLVLNWQGKFYLYQKNS